MLTKVQLNRLQKLHDYVKNHVSPKYFDMSHFRGGEMEEYTVTLTSVKEHTCGTDGCLLGWSPFALYNTVARLKLLPKYGYQGNLWGNLSYNLFGVSVAGALWDYLFSADWGDRLRGLSRQKQKRAALKRIRNVIKSKGEITEKMENELLNLRGY